MPQAKSKPKIFLIGALFIIAGIAGVVFILFLFFSSLIKLPQDLTSEEIIGNIQQLAINDRNYESSLQLAGDLTQDDPSNADAWHWKGISEFELERYDEAKISFQRVISIDPEHNAAKNYLKILDENSFEATTSLSHEEFESLIKINFDQDILTFIDASSTPNDQYTVFISAVYESDGLLEDIQDYLEDMINEKGFQAEINDSDDSISIAGIKDKENFSATIWKRAPIQILIIYTILK